MQFPFPRLPALALMLGLVICPFALSANPFEYFQSAPTKAISRYGTWDVEIISIDDEIVSQIVEGNARTDPNAVDRLIEALETTYSDAQFRIFTSESAPFSVVILEKNGEAILVKLFLSTTAANFSEDEAKNDLGPFLEIVVAASKEPLRFSGKEFVSIIWGSYMDPDAREYKHGWVSLSETEFKTMAWGVPPDFIEIVVTSRPDCEFLPVKGWLARQICK